MGLFVETVALGFAVSQLLPAALDVLLALADVVPLWLKKARLVLRADQFLLELVLPLYCDAIRGVRKDAG